MSGLVITYRTKLRRQPESRLTALPSPPCAPVTQLDAPGRAPQAATPVARMLALAHHIERLVEAGELRDYADAARQLGMAKSHVTHIMNLLSLAPDIQQAILEGRIVTTEHALRGLCQVMGWDQQARAIQPA